MIPHKSSGLQFENKVQCQAERRAAAQGQEAVIGPDQPEMRKIVRHSSNRARL